MSVPLGWKVHLSLKILKLFFASQHVLLSGDVMLNPGPLSNESFSPSDPFGFGNESFSSLDSESDRHDSFASQFNTSTSSLNDFEPHLYFNLGLPCKGLRIVHWNVNHLTSSKFDQIKLFLKKKDGTPQVDVIWLHETFLKSDIPDALYLSLDLRSSDVTGDLKMAVEYWLLLMMNCLQSVGLIWKTQIWKYCGSRLLLSNLKDPYCWLESIDLHPLPELMISPLKITLKGLIYLIKRLSWSEILILMPPIPRRTINIALAKA